MPTLTKRFDKFDTEFLHFERIQNPPSQRPDLCAFLLLDKLFPGTRDIVDGAEHDQIFLGVDAEEFQKLITDEDILYLVRCGVHFDLETYSLAMFT